MEIEKADELMRRCPECLNLFPLGIGQMEEGFIACAVCGAKYGAEIANSLERKEDS